MSEKNCVFCNSDDLHKDGKDFVFAFINYFCNFCNANYGVFDEQEYLK